MNTKKIISLVVLLIVLVALFVGSLYLRNKNSEKFEQISNNNNGLYTSNAELGYEFTIANQNIDGWEEERQGYQTWYYLPTTDRDWNKDGNFYSVVYSVTAIPKAEVEKSRKICDNNQQESWYECVAFTHTIGENNLYTFVSIPAQDAPQDFVDSMIIENVTNQIKTTFKTFNVSNPQVLSYDYKKSGFGIKASTDLSTDYSASDNISLPFETDKFSQDIGLSKILPIQYCGLSGECQPTTTNYAVTVGLLDLTETQLLAFPIADDFTKVNRNLATIYEYSQGAEGEGINYFFLVMPDSKIFVVAHRYLDETTNLRYKNVKNFTTYKKQTENVAMIVENFNTFSTFKELSQTNK